MGSSRKYAASISSIASPLYFFLIIFQIPLFRVPCGSGICTSPIEVTSSQLIASELFPPYVVKALLYPGALAKAILKKSNIPSYNKLLNSYNFTNVNNASAATDLDRLEVFVGCYLSVAGALLGLIRAGRMSLFGTLITLWGLAKELMRKRGGIIPTKAVSIYPTMSIALLFAFLSVRSDLRKIFRCFRVSKRFRRFLQLKTKHT